MTKIKKSILRVQTIYLIYLWKFKAFVKFEKNRVLIRQKKESVKYWTKRLSYMMNPFPVYWASDSRDCDHVRATSPHRSSNGYIYTKDVDALYEGAEGPTSHWRITKSEYRGFVSSWRDYNSEAHENGHPYNPYY